MGNELMSREFGSKKDGTDFSEEIIQQVWDKGEKVLTHNPNKVRQDCCAAIIERDQYGQLGSTGWEIDHIKPVSRGGKDNINNLQPLQWENNRAKGDMIGSWKCKRGLKYATNNIL